MTVRLDPTRSLLLLLPLGSLAAGCDGGKDETPEDSDTAGETAEDTETAGETDTGEATTFAALLGSPELVEATDVVATEAALYIVGFTAEDEAAVFAVDLTGGGLTVLFQGAPLVQPTGITASSDGATLYLTDLASDPVGLVNGGVYSLPVSGGALTELSVGTVDLPGDVTLAHGGGSLYVSGFTTAGSPAIFAVTLAGAATVAWSGAPLVDPLALAAGPDGDALFVVDALAASEKAAVLRFELPGFEDSTLVGGLDLAFPGGLAAGGDFLYASAVGDPSVFRIAPDGSAFTVLDTMGLLELPAGVAASADALFVTELSSLGGADLYTLTY